MAPYIFVLNGELNGKIVVVRFFCCWVYVTSASGVSFNPNAMFTRNLGSLPKSY